MNVTACGVGPELGHSYVCADAYGGGVVPVFSFFTQFDRTWKHAGTLEAAVLIIIFLTSLIGNSLVLKLILSKRGTKTITNLFVCNLIVTDLLYILTIPFIAAVRVTSTWVLGRFMCSFINYWLFVCGSTMIWTMTAISIDRYVNINVGISTGRRLTKRHVAVFNVALWLIGVLLYIPIAQHFQVISATAGNNVFEICTLIWSDRSHNQSLIFVSIVSVLSFVVPINIITVNYARIYLKYRKSRRAVEGFNADNNTNTVQARTPVNSSRYRVLKTLVTLVVAFIVMWTPVFAAFMAIEYDKINTQYKVSSSLLLWTTAVCYLNTILNAFLYGLTTKQIREKVGSIKERFTNHAETTM